MTFYGLPTFTGLVLLIHTNKHLKYYSHLLKH